nr:XdhC family protein [Spirochaeta sp.]
TETLARLFTQLGVPTTLIAQEVNQDALPGAVRCTCGAEHPQSLEVPAGAAVVVGSHLPTDPHYVRTALDAGSPYVGMIGSRKRALEVLGVLGIDEGDHVKRPLYVPAGVDIAAETPEEIALSIVVEILLLPEGSR